MKQNNFFTSLSPLARTTLIICLVALPILIISAVFIVLAVANNKGNDINQVTLNPTNTITPSFTYSSNPTVPAVTHTVSPTTDPYAGWKDYYFAQYDISFKYPSDWEVTVVDKPIGEDGPDQIPCTSDYVKQTKLCTNKEIDLAPFINIEKNNETRSNKNLLSFAIFRYSDKFTLSDTSRIINDSNIEINNKIYKKVEEYFKNESFLNTRLHYYDINTGDRSNYKSFFIFGQSTLTESKTNRTYLEIEEQIVKSIH